MFVIASISGSGVVCSTKRFGFKLGALDVFGDKDCLNAALHWCDIAKTNREQPGIDGQKLIDSLLILKMRGFKGLIIGSGFEENYVMLKQAKEILPLFANSISIFELLQNPRSFFEILNTLKVPFPQTLIPSDQFLGEEFDWIIKDLRSSGGLGTKKFTQRKSSVKIILPIKA